MSFSQIEILFESTFDGMLTYTGNQGLKLPGAFYFVLFVRAVQSYERPAIFFIACLLPLCWFHHNLKEGVPFVGHATSKTTI